MLETDIKELLARLRHGLEQLYGERLAGVYLFGSFARGEATPDSDVDILVVLDEVTDYGQEIERTGHLISELSLDYDVSISRVFVSSSAWQHRDSPFLSNVREQARAA
jgi:predicted nucleotidyltransferase